MKNDLVTHQTLGTCIVLGVETQIGLSIIRELGMAGVKVIALSQGSEAMGLASKFVFRGEVVRPRSEELLARLRELGATYGPCSLIAISEANLSWLAQNQEALGPNVIAALPSADALKQVLDKQQTLAAAVLEGIAVPLTEEPRSWADVERMAERFPFPAVLKWKDAEAVVEALVRHGIGYIKAEYVYNASELLAALQRYRPLGQWPLVQQYCRGQGLGQFFFLHHGQVLQRFQHLRVAEWPPEGGFSSVCDGLPLQEYAGLQEKSVQLLQRIGWEGVAMVEYRLDRASGQAVLMEINGRFWGSFPLAMYSGAKFAVLTHRVALRLPLDSLPAPREDLRCRMVLTELKRLIRLFLQPSKIQDRSYRIQRGREAVRFIGDFFKPRVRYFIWSIHDPAPWFADMRNIMVKVLRQWRQPG